MLNHSLSNSSLWNTNIAFQISTSSFWEMVAWLIQSLVKDTQAGTHIGPLCPPGSCLRALDWSTLWSGRCDHISLSVFQAPGTTAGDWLQTFGLVFKYIAPIALSWTCRFYRPSAVPLISSASSHRGIQRLPEPQTSKGLQKHVYSSSWSISHCPLYITSEPHLCHTEPRKFSRGLWPPWHSSPCGMMPLATLFPNSNLQVWMFLRLSTSSFGAEWEEKKIGTLTWH